MLTVNVVTKKEMEKEIAPTSSFGIKLQKYGEILLSSDGDEFILCCTLCIEIFFEYTHFLKHARIQHNVEIDDTRMHEKSSADFEWEQSQELETVQEQCQCVVEETNDENLLAIQNTKDQIITTEIAVDHSEEVICHTTTDYNNEEMRMEEVVLNSEVNVIAKDNYNVEYLLEDCLDYDDAFVSYDENSSAAQVRVLKAL